MGRANREKLRQGMERILREQREARDYLSEHGPDRGAEQGATDWVAEEVITMADPLERAE